MQAKSSKELYEKAKLIYANKYESKHKKENILTKIPDFAVKKDKLYSIALAVQDDPYGNLYNLQRLLRFCRGNRIRDIVVTTELLKDLYLNHLLPDHKIQPFEEICAQKGDDTSKSELCEAYYFSELKKNYKSFRDFIKKVIKDKTFEWLKTKLIDFSFELLSNKPEGEEDILMYLAKALLLPDKTIRNKIVFGFKKLVKFFPEKKKKVANELETLLQSIPRENYTTQHLVISILHQFRFSKSGSDQNLPEILLNIYLGHFKVITNHFNGFVHSQKVDSACLKLISSLLKGANKAILFAENFSLGNIDAHLSTLYKTTYFPHFNTTIIALALLLTIYEKQNNVPDRFFNALYSSLIHKEILRTTKMVPYLSTVFRALKHTDSADRLKAFSKRILQVSLHMAPLLTASCLLTVSELARIKPLVLKPLIKERDAAAGSGYDMSARNPAASNAKEAVLVELLALKCHYNPKIAFFADTLSRGELIEYNGDPLAGMKDKCFVQNMLREAMEKRK